MPLKVLIIPDKFKGTLTAGAAAEAIARGWRKARWDDLLKLLPMSDGGDGFGEVMSGLLHAEAKTVRTVDAAHRRCAAKWWWEPKTRTAIIESATVIGLAMLPPKAFHPIELDTFGLGAVMSEAVKRLEAAKPQSAHDVRLHHQPLVAFPPPVAQEEAAIKAFLKQRMYRHERVMRVMGEAEQILFDLFARYQESPGDLPAEWVEETERETESGRARRIGNFIAGMTDRFALTEHQRLFDSTPDLR